jgi:autotransporter adhesin
LTTAIGATNAIVNTHTNQIANLTSGLARANNRIDTANQGIAMGFAMNAAPLNLAPGEGGASFGVGTFEGEVAVAVKLQGMSADGVGYGLSIGASDGAVGVGAGIGFKF